MKGILGLKCGRIGARTSGKTLRRGSRASSFEKAVSNIKVASLKGRKRREKTVPFWILSCVIAVLLPIGGCDSGTVDKLDLTFTSFDTTVEVDTFCDNGGCTGNDEIKAILEFQTDTFIPEDAEVQFRQYRVDYDLEDVERDVPFFAAPINITVTQEDTTSFTFKPAGNIQRDFIYEHYSDETLEGEATLTLAGYDDQNEQAFLEKTFAIRFGDFSPDD